VDLDSSLEMVNVVDSDLDTSCVGEMDVVCVPESDRSCENVLVNEADIVTVKEGDEDPVTEKLALVDTDMDTEILFDCVTDRSIEGEVLELVSCVGDPVIDTDTEVDADMLLETVMETCQDSEKENDWDPVLL